MSPSILASLLPTAAASPAPVPGLSTGRNAAAAQEPAFARQLEQSRQARAPESPRPAAPNRRAEPAHPAETNNAARPSAPPPKPASPARTDANRKPAAPSGGKATADADTREVDADADADAGGAAETDATEAGQDAVQDLLACMAPASAGTAAAASTPTPGADPSPPLPAAALPAEPGAARNSMAVGEPDPALAATAPVPRAMAMGAAQAERISAGDPRQAALALPADNPAWQQARIAAEGSAAAHALGDLREMRQADATAGSPALAALGSLAGPHAAAGKTGEVPVVQLATPATSTEFRAALGSQVSWFARAGVQQAELHLNPAEMGPVSIHIVLDGQQAQVNFGADSPLTRQIIESGMPELAGALRDAGLTLTGGGVSQHAGGQRQPAEREGSQGGTAADARAQAASDAVADVAAAPLRRGAQRGTAGGLDTYA
jgi:flagellar hook-length control protein FliK